MVALFAIFGGEYKLQTTLPSSTAKIAIPVFINKTFREDLTGVLTEEVVNQFMLRTGLELVTEKEAEFILKGRILQYTKEPLSEITAGVDEYRVRIEILASLFSKNKNRVLWEERISQSAVYSVLQVGSLQTEEEAIREVCQKIGKELVNLTLEGWRD